MMKLIVFIVILSHGRASKFADSYDNIELGFVDPCSQYKMMDGINYTLTTNIGSDTSCVDGCLYIRDDGKEGNVCVEKPANNPQSGKRSRAKSAPIYGCPTPSQTPIIMDKQIVSAYFWHGHGHDIAELGCNGDGWYVPAGTRITTVNDYQCYPMGSIVVNPGCRLILFEYHNFQGRYRILGSKTYPKIPYEWAWWVSVTEPYRYVPCFRSFLSSCQQTYPNCVPEDDWVTIKYLDNKEGTEPTTFTYTETIGTTFSTEMEMSFGVSITVEKEVSASFFDLFGAKIGVSGTTNFNWRKTDTRTRSRSEQVEVQQEVPAGKSLYIQQAVGRCGGSTVYTQLTKIVNS